MRDSAGVIDRSTDTEMNVFVHSKLVCEGAATVGFFSVCVLYCAERLSQNNEQRGVDKLRLLVSRGFVRS